MTANRATYAILAHQHHPRILIRRIRAGSDALRAAEDRISPRVTSEERKRSSLGLRKQVVQRSELLFLIKIDRSRFSRARARKLAFPPRSGLLSEKNAGVKQPPLG